MDGAQASNVDIASNAIQESEPTPVNQHSNPPQESITSIGDQDSISPVKIDFSRETVRIVFDEQCGRVVKFEMEYDEAGRSKGAAVV